MQRFQPWTAAAGWRSTPRDASRVVDGIAASVRLFHASVVVRNDDCKFHEAIARNNGRLIAVSSSSLAIERRTTHEKSSIPTTVSRSLPCCECSAEQSSSSHKLEPVILSVHPRNSASPNTRTKYRRKTPYAAEEPESVGEFWCFPGSGWSSTARRAWARRLPTGRPARSPCR